MQWIELTIKTASPGIDLLAARLTALGYDSFIMDDQADFHDFLDQNRQYWNYVDQELEEKMAGISQIRLYLENTSEAPAQITALRQSLPTLRQQFPGLDFGPLTVETAQCHDEDWENSWKQYYQPLSIGRRLLVVPQWLETPNPQNRVEIRLDPGMIFGTGAHASTQMCLCALENVVHGGERVIDLGSGSGILSIAALLLGAATAVGVDVDPKAEDIARENARLNRLGPERFRAVTGDVIGDRAVLDALRGDGYDLVLANIVADVIIPLAPLVPQFLRPGGTFICSGILDTHLPEVLASLSAAGLTLTDQQQQGDWCRLSVAAAP